MWCGGVVFTLGTAKSIKAHVRVRLPTTPSPSHLPFPRCTTAILFMTDGKNSGAATPASIIKTRIADDDKQAPRVFTYNFGSGANDDTQMKEAACAGNGVFQKVADNGNLKVAMASYFSYLAAGLVPKSGEKQQVRWAEMYEDGQGMGPNTAACTPVYDHSVTPSDLFGVLCNSIAEGTLKGFPDWDDEWKKIKDSAATCPSLDLTEKELEQIRSTIPGGKSCCQPGPCQSTSVNGAPKMGPSVGITWGLSLVLPLLVLIAAPANDLA